MGVDGRGRNAFMAEESLQEPEVHTIFQQEGRAGVTQHVRRDAGLNACCDGEVP